MYDPICPVCQGVMTNTLKMKEFTLTVTVVPTILEQKLYGAKVERKQVTVSGYTLKDAKKRAGIA